MRRCQGLVRDPIPQPNLEETIMTKRTKSAERALEILWSGEDVIVPADVLDEMYELESELEDEEQVLAEASIAESSDEVDVFYVEAPEFEEYEDEDEEEDEWEDEEDAEWEDEEDEEDED